LWDRIEPDYCDEPYVNGSGTPDYIAVEWRYRGYGQPVDPFEVPHVVPAAKLEIYQTKFNKLYAGKRPEFDNPGYAIVTPGQWEGYGDTAGQQYDARRVVGGVITDNYPHIDYTKITNKVLKLFVGSGTVFNGTYPATTGSTRVETSVMVDNYWEVLNVKYLDADWGKVGYFDDDVEVFFTDPGTGLGTGTSSVPNGVKVFKALRESEVTFEVTYGDGTKETLTVDEFLGNSEWFYKQYGLGPALSGSNFMQSMIWGSDFLKVAPGNVSILRYYADERDPAEGEPNIEQAWRVFLDYAPWAYQSDATISHVAVPVSLFIWENEFEAESLGNNPGLWTNGGSATNGERPFTAAAPGGQSEIDAIAKKWRLDGTYSNDTYGEKHKKITVTERMFYDGYGYASMIGMQSATSSIDAALANGSYVGQLIMTQLGSNNSMWNYSGNFNGWTNSIQSGVVFTNYELPIYYREVYLQDVDDGILVDLQGRW